MLGPKTNLRDTTIRAIVGLATFLDAGMRSQLEPCRLARAGYALLQSGCSAKEGTFPGSELAYYVIKMQQDDGGWTNTEETLWCLAYLSSFAGRYETQIKKGVEWLVSVRLLCGAFGNSSRDCPRIPITSLATILAPACTDNYSAKWVAQRWETDLEGNTKLTYKGAYYLLTKMPPISHSKNKLLGRTVNFLKHEQDNSGGFGPWKGHPLGCDAWSTGIVLWGLSRLGTKSPKIVIKRAIEWLQRTQLPSGMWPYHYLDDGTSMALIGITSALTALGATECAA